MANNINTLENKITYDDTRDVSIRIIEKLIQLGHLKDDNEHYFEVQDTIHDEVNSILGLDIDCNFSVEIKKTKNGK